MHIYPPQRRRTGFRPQLMVLEDRRVPAVILSDNLAKTTTNIEAVAGNRWVTSSFGTGTSAHTLTSITLKLANPVSGSASLMLYSDGSLEPGNLLATLTSPTSYSSTLA